MAVPRSSIAHWTQAELQAFIQNIAKFEASSLPASMNPNSLEAQIIRVADSLDFSENSRLSQDGVIFDPITFLGSGFTGNAESMFAETTGTALWRAGGGSILAQVGDLPDFGDEYSANDGVVRGSAIYLPARAQVSTLHCYTSTIPSAYSSTSTGTALGLYSTDGNPSPVLTLLEAITSISSDLVGSTGFKSYPLASTHVLEAGVYYVCILTNWTSITGTLGLAAKMGTRAAQNDSQLGGPMRVVHDSGVTSLQSTMSSLTAQAARPWFGIS